MHYRNTITRRSFIATGASLVCMPTWSDENRLPIIDTHQHLWDRSKLQLDWIPKGSVLDRNFLPEDYEQATAKLNVVQAVYMEVDVTPVQHATEAEYISDLCRKKNSLTRAAVISGRPNAKNFPEYLDMFRENPFVKGLRQVLHSGSTPAGYSLSPEFIRGIKELGKLRMSFDLCLRESDLADGVKLAEACPDTQFILDHCGNPNVRQKPSYAWLRSIEDLAKQTNVAVKISGVIAGADPQKNFQEQLSPFVNHVWDSFGPDRVVFGGDWPVCLLGGTYGDWVQTLRLIAANRSLTDRQKLFHENAIRIYRLSAT